MEPALTLSAGPLSCRLFFGNSLSEKTARNRYRGFISDIPSENYLGIFPAADLIPREEEFNLCVRSAEKGFYFFSSSTDGYFNLASRSGSLNISAARLDNPATLENAFRCLFSLLAVDRGFVFFHGAAYSRDNKAWIFLGPSGSGKSTVASYARRRGYNILSDDLVLLGGGKKLRVFSSPFFGQMRAGVDRQESFDIEGIYLLQKAGCNSFLSISSTSEKTAHLMANVPFTESCDTQTMNRILNIVSRVGEGINLYQMRFTDSPEFLDLLI